MHTAANDNRPASFDARLVAHIPMLEKLAKRYCHPNERDEVVQDTIAEALTKWHLFRPDGSFYKWLRFRFMGVSSNRKRGDRLRYRMTPTMDIADARTTPASQEHAVDLSTAITALASITYGGELLKRSIGYTLEEVGADVGTKRERSRQRTEQARVELMEALDVAA